MNRPKLPITLRALLQRIDRALAKKDQCLKKTLSEQAVCELGEYYIFDRNKMVALKDHVDPEALGKELGVLNPYEGVTE